MISLCITNLLLYGDGSIAKKWEQSKSRDRPRFSPVGAALGKTWSVPVFDLWRTSLMDELLYELRDRVAYVTFNRPQARNALTFAMYERLAEICKNADADRSIKAILITGGGDKAFAAGTDISQFRTFDKEQDALDYEARIDRVMDAIEHCRIPTIAAIHGACTGGGASIAACWALRIASRGMKYG